MTPAEKSERKGGASLRIYFPLLRRQGLYTGLLGVPAPAKAWWPSLRGLLSTLKGISGEYLPKELGVSGEENPSV